MTTRIKKNRVIYKSKAEFEHALDKLGLLQLELETMIAEHNERKALEDKKHKAALKRKNAQLSELFAGCELYADFNRDVLLGEKKSGESKLAEFGFRKSPGIVKVLNSKWTIGKAVEAIKSAGKAVSDKCLKVTTSLDKQGVKKHLTEPEMAKYGLRIDAPEEFWAEPKRATDTPDQKVKG